MRTLAAVVSLLLVAGCADEASTPPAPAGPAAPIHDLPGTAANATGPSESTFLLPISQAAPVGGFRVTVPEDRAFALFAGSSFTYYRIVVELVADSLPDGAVVLLFSGDELITVFAMEPVRGTTWLTAALPTDAAAPAHFGPAETRLIADAMPEELGVVVAARGLTGPAALRLHFAAGADESITAGQTAMAQVLPPIGNGTAYEIHERVEVSVGLVLPVGLLGYELEVGSPVRHERLATFVMPHGGARDATLEASCSLGGWGYAATTYLAGEGAVDWAHEVVAGGASASDEGVMVYGDGYGLLATALVVGLPIGYATGDGPDAVKAHLDVASAESGQIHLGGVAAICLDAPLSTLLDTPAPGTAVIFEGLVRWGGPGDMEVAGVRWLHPGFDTTAGR